VFAACVAICGLVAAHALSLGVQLLLVMLGNGIPTEENYLLGTVSTVALSYSYEVAYGLLPGICLLVLGLVLAGFMARSTNRRTSQRGLILVAVLAVLTLVLPVLGFSYLRFGW
jgi:hypothetical protein